MLEEAELMLQLGEEPGSFIITRDGVKSLGGARWHLAPHGWLRWLARPTLEVREDLDEPLLMTIRRSWGFRTSYEVRDAEGHLVGTVGEQRLCLHFFVGRTLTIKHIAGKHTLYSDEQGEPLASWLPTARGGRLTFLSPVRNHPFLKMLILAAALVRGG